MDNNSRRRTVMSSPRAAAAALDRIGSALKMSSLWVKEQTRTEISERIHHMKKPKSRRSASSMSEVEDSISHQRRQQFTSDSSEDTEREYVIRIAPTIQVSLDSPKHDSECKTVSTKPNKSSTRRGNGRWWSLYNKSSRQLTRSSTSPQLGSHRTCTTPKSALSTSTRFQPRHDPKEQPKRVHFPNSPRSLTKVRELPMSSEDIEARQGILQRSSRSRSSSHPPCGVTSQSYEAGFTETHEPFREVEDNVYEGPLEPKFREQPKAPPRPVRGDLISSSSQLHVHHHHHVCTKHHSGSQQRHGISRDSHADSHHERSKHCNHRHQDRKVPHHISYGRHTSNQQQRTHTSHDGHVEAACLRSKSAATVPSTENNTQRTEGRGCINNSHRTGNSHRIRRYEEDVEDDKSENNDDVVLYPGVTVRSSTQYKHGQPHRNKNSAGKLELCQSNTRKYHQSSNFDCSTEGSSGLSPTVRNSRRRRQQFERIYMSDLTSSSERSNSPKSRHGQFW